MLLPFTGSVGSMLSTVLKCSTPCALSLSQATPLQHCTVTVATMSGQTNDFKELVCRLKETGVRFRIAKYYIYCMIL